MDAALTEEQHEIRRTLRDLLRRHCGPDEVKAAVRTPPGYDEQLWHRLAGRLGLPGLALPAAYGGVGCGPTELALACEETGRALLPSPLIATAALAAPLILALGSDRQRGTLLPALASGELTGTLVVPGDRLTTALTLTGANDGDWAGDGRAGGIQARMTEDGWRLYGEAGQVLNGHTADVLLVAAHTGGFVRGRTLLFAVRADGAPGLLRVRQTSLDETRLQARIQLRDVRAELLGEGKGPRNGPSRGSGGGLRGGTGDGPSRGTGHGSGNDPRDDDATAVAAALAATGAVAAAALATEAVGAADAALTRTVAYVKEREQFGRPIGSFQAVQHRLADLYVTLQAARSAAYYAAWSAGRRAGPGTPPVADQSDDGDGGGRGAAEPGVGALALAQALEALRAVAGEAVQLHGGIGFTWEHAAHLYVKRAACDELLLGPAHRLRARAAEEAGLFAGVRQEARRRGTRGRGAREQDGGPAAALPTREAVDV
ncbi:putative acyl-CoA dehydrogenase [Streptomyces sp. NBRC 110611]|uniref:acyl-CoA dehydrogenase family protein n=1 Tax=Streptomyces sp. NBRC 110611 TaxID=1621259 RepID=UPI0008295A80|nr:acyl-CoA dehydrogenase family protein [Streptomyces sp. NBRC 110611]GAU67468.1 putative acyl-CoA dehydrogenase [Streptomyces sp. NBRC 110611]